MDPIRWPRRSGILLLLLLVLVVALAVGAARDLPADAAPVFPQPWVAVPAQGPGIGETVCEIVRSEAVGAAATQLISSIGIPGSALLGQVVVTAVQKNCSRLIGKGIQIVRNVLATFRPPSRPVYPQLPVYSRFLPDRRAGTIAKQLGTTEQYVVNARNGVCNAVSATLNPADVIARSFPRARLQHLSGMNAFIYLVVDTCRGLDRADANFITGAVTNLVLGNEYQRDLDPPAVQIYRSEIQRYGGGVSVATARFRWFDRGGVRSCEIMLWLNGAWHARSGGCAMHSAQLRHGERYAWAFRAKDSQGYVSQWVVTSYGTS